MFGWKLAITCFLKQEKLRMSSRLLQMQIFKANNNKETKNQKSKCDSSKSSGTDGWWILPGLPAFHWHKVYRYWFLPDVIPWSLKKSFHRVINPPLSIIIQWICSLELDTKYIRYKIYEIDCSHFGPMKFSDFSPDLNFFPHIPRLFPQLEKQSQLIFQFFPDYQHS